MSAPESCGEDRRGHEEDRRSSDFGPPTGTPERRKPGRPPKPDSERRRFKTRHVKLALELDAAVVRLATARGLTFNGFIVKAVSRLAQLEAAAISGRSEIPPSTDRT